MSKSVKLKLDWCSFKAAEFACKNWHYSKSIPAGKLVKIGVWENDKFIGCVIFGRGANHNLLTSFKLSQDEGCELVRIAMTDHITPVSKILSIACKMLKKYCPGLKLVVSYADKTNENHHGGIYQAAGWHYLGLKTTSAKGAYYKIRGKKMHGRSARSLYGHERKFPKPWEHWPPQSKHQYVKILDSNYLLDKIKYPYPKR